MTDAQKEPVEAEADDAELLQRCQRGDERALAELVNRYQQRLFGLALRVAGDPSLAEEAAVDALYKIWRKVGQWRGGTSPESWIYRIAVRTVLDLKRSRTRWWQRAELAAEADSPDVDPGPAAELAAGEERQAAGEMLAGAIESLPPDDRALVHLYYFEERGLKEIESILEVPQANLKMRLARARKKLRRVLKAE